MPAADSTRPEGAPQFRSPKRALARSFRLSRDRWKLKAGQRRQQIKALQVKVRDLEVSRDLWKQKALHLQEQFQEFLGLVPSAQEQGHHPAALEPNQPPPASDGADPQQATTPQATATEPPDQPPQGSAAGAADTAPAAGGADGPVKKKRPVARG